jgi:hypothetical protein
MSGAVYLKGKSREKKKVLREKIPIREHRGALY